MGGKTDEALAVLRGIWSARGQSARDVAEACDDGRSCKKMADVGFDGLAASGGGDLRAAWRTQLAREGKLDPAAGSVRDLVLPEALPAAFPGGTHPPGPPAGGTTPLQPPAAKHASRAEC
jgi:hypothetical protein